uniref:Reverse transcriptase/retrotransposon-derived protein RNase H-like domain-containing protein n=1 Tax=Mus spicilegus TaxID=10103 RepID=A0A8C6H8Q9_MUSSI
MLSTPVGLPIPPTSPPWHQDPTPLYSLTKEKGKFAWTRKHQLAFETLKKALLQAPALALPDLNKPFTLYIDERNGVARGVLTQVLGPWKCLVGYLSKKLDPVASGWPSCLQVIAATAVLERDADKLTMGQNLNVNRLLMFKWTNHVKPRQFLPQSHSFSIKTPSFQASWSNPLSPV